MKKTGMTLVTLTLILSFSVACVPLTTVSNPPDPSLLAPEEFKNLGRVKTEYKAVAGFPEHHTPAPYNQSHYLRYYLPRNQGESSSILIIMPGIIGGALSADSLARQLVLNLSDFEVWVLDRRVNQLEDRSAEVASVQQKDPLIAYNYYIKNRGKRGGFHPLKVDDVPFVRHWGLEVMLRDLHEVVKRAEARSETVLLGGHSQGASFASYYAAFNFGSPIQPDPGFEHLDGLVLLDGVLGRLGARAWEDPGVDYDPVFGREFGIRLIPPLTQLDEGTGEGWINLGLSPEFFAGLSVKALLARFDPEGLAPPGFFSFPMTNEALFGVAMDDDFLYSTPFSISMGEATCATFGGNIVAFLLQGVVGVYSQSVTGVADGCSAVAWKREAEGGFENYTDPTLLSENWVSEHTNSLEWYSLLRLTVEDMSMNLRFDNQQCSRDTGSLEQEGNATPSCYVQPDEVTTPTLLIGGGRGWVNDIGVAEAYMNTRPSSLFSLHVIPGYTHNDVVMAERNLAVGLIERWLAAIGRLNPSP